MRISLKQWRMFHAVVDCDGFADAAERLHVSQSSISHALAKLQDQLGVTLLALKGRKARLTEEGKVLLERSRALVKDAVELEDLADNLRQGWGPEIRLAVDPDFPSEILMHALREFSTSSHKVRLSVQEAPAERSCQALLDNAIDFAIVSRQVPGFSAHELVGIEHVAVAHPSNPLFSLKRHITWEDLRTQYQVAISGSNDYALPDGGQWPPRSPQPWNVSSIERAVAALGEGFGYAWLPHYRLRRWIDGDLLRILPLQGGSSHTTCLYLVAASSVSGNTCAMRFADALRRRSGASI